MSVRKAIHQRLRDASAISALVSTRLYQDWAPASATLPYLVISIPSQGHVHHLKGASGLSMPRLQVDCYADDPIDVETLAEAVRNNLDGVHGTVGVTDTVNVRKCYLVSQTTDDFSPPDASDSPREFRRIMEFEMGVVESIPTN